MRRRRSSAFVTAIALLAALAVAIPQSYAARNAAKPAAKKGAKDRQRGSGRQTGPSNRPSQRHNVGPGTSNPLARKPLASRGARPTRTAAASTTTGKPRTASTGAKKSNLRKTGAKRQTRPTTRRARVKPLKNGSRRQEGQAGAPDESSRGRSRQAIGDGETGDLDPSADGGYQEPGRKGLSSAVKKAFKVLGMGVLAVGIGAVFIAGGAPLMALSVPVMMFAIGSGQIIAKPEIDPNQMMVPPGMGGGQDLNDDGMTPQERYRFLARDNAVGGNLPGGLPSRNGLQAPPVMDMGGQGP